MPLPAVQAWRRAHNRLIGSGESVAMMGGEGRELVVLNGKLDAIGADLKRQD